MKFEWLQDEVNDTHFLCLKRDRGLFFRGKLSGEIIGEELGIHSRKASQRRFRETWKSLGDSVSQWHKNWQRKNLRSPNAQREKAGCGITNHTTSVGWIAKKYPGRRGRVDMAKNRSAGWFQSSRVWGTI